MNEERWHAAKNLLCIRLDYLGDVLMCTPALRALRESVPGRRITLLTSAGGAAAAPHIPEVDDVLTYAAPWMKSSQPHGSGFDLAFAERLRAGGFDGAVIFTTWSQSPLPAAFLCYLAAIPLRLAHCRENPYQMLTDWLPETEPEQQVRHETRRQLDLVASIGCLTDNERLSFRIRDEDRAWIRERIGAGGIDASKPWLLCHPGASAASRRYPVGHWIEASRRLVQQAGFPLVFTGSRDEAALVDEIREGCGGKTTSLAGELDLGRLGAALSLATVAVSGNTGPAHIAAAAGTPVVDLYALTNPQHTPWQVPNRVLFRDVPCRFCYRSVCPQGHHRCLAGVEPGTVVDAVLSLVREGRGGSPATDETLLSLLQKTPGA